MTLYYEDIALVEVFTNRSMTEDEILEFTEFDMDAFAKEQGWDDWDWEKLHAEW